MVLQLRTCDSHLPHLVLRIHQILHWWSSAVLLQSNSHNLDSKLVHSPLLPPSISLIRSSCELNCASTENESEEGRRQNVGIEVGKLWLQITILKEFGFFSKIDQLHSRNHDSQFMRNWPNTLQEFQGASLSFFVNSFHVRYADHCLVAKILILTLLLLIVDAHSSWGGADHAKMTQHIKVELKLKCLTA